MNKNTTSLVSEIIFEKFPRCARLFVDKFMLF